MAVLYRQRHLHVVNGHGRILRSKRGGDWFALSIICNWSVTATLIDIPYRISITTPPLHRQISTSTPVQQCSIYTCTTEPSTKRNCTTLRVITRHNDTTSVNNTPIATRCDSNVSCSVNTTTAGAVTVMLVDVFPVSVVVCVTNFRCSGGLCRRNVGVRCQSIHNNIVFQHVILQSPRNSFLCFRKRSGFDPKYIPQHIMFYVWIACTCIFIHVCMTLYVTPI